MLRFFGDFALGAGAAEGVFGALAFEPLGAQLLGSRLSGFDPVEQGEGIWVIASPPAVAGGTGTPALCVDRPPATTNGGDVTQTGFLSLAGFGGLNLGGA